MKSTLALFAVVALVASGCAGPAYSRSETTSQAARSAAAETNSTQTTLDATMAGLKDLVLAKDGDLKGRFDVFSGDFDRLSESVKASQRRADDLQVRVRAHLDAWEKDLAKVQNEELKANSRKHREAIETGMAKVNESAAVVRTKADPFLRDLGDIRKVLATDLTQGGLSAVRSAAGKAEADSKAVREAIVRFGSDLDALSTELSTGTPKAQNPPEPTK